MHTTNTADKIPCLHASEIPSNLDIVHTLGPILRKELNRLHKAKRKLWEGFRLLQSCLPSIGNEETYQAQDVIEKEMRTLLSVAQTYGIKIPSHLITSCEL